MKPLTQKTVFLLLFYFFIAGSNDLFGQRDFQPRNETVFAVPVIEGKDKSGKPTEKLTLLFFGTVRFGQNRFYAFDRRVSAGFEYRVNKHFVFSPTYQYRYGESVRDNRKFEHRVRIDATLEQKWDAFAIKDRSRYEIQIKNNGENDQLYRNRLTLEFPIKKSNNKFVPFVSGEYFYSNLEKSWNSREFTVGIKSKFNKRLSSEIFYLRRYNTTGGVRLINAITANLKITFDNPFKNKK